MKNFSNIKIAFLLLTFVTTTLVMVSCNDNHRSEDTKDVAREYNEARFDNNKQQRDAQFLVNAAEMNLEQIHLGQQAQQRGNAQHIKELGKMLEDAHTRSLNELRTLSQSKSMTIPSSPTNDSRDTYSDLNDKSGNDYDKAYANLMVNKHRDAISTYESAAEDRNDAEIKNWARSSLPIMRRHLDRSIESQKQFDDHMYLEENTNRNTDRNTNRTNRN